MAENTVPRNATMMEARDLPPNPLAVVLDGEVVLVMNTDERSAAIFTSNPEFVPFTRTGTFNPRVGWKYADGNFTAPEEGTSN
jgi:hypothetical protein